MEEWRNIPIEGYEHYQVSNLGMVKGPKGLRSINTSRNGYCFITGKFKGKSKRLYVHRLVALTFIDNPDNKPQVNHIDGDKTNNHVNNLEWVTCQENMKHARKNGFFDSSIKERQKRIVLKNENKELFFDSISQAAITLGVSKSLIWAAANNYRRNKTCKGYSVCYV